MERNVIAEAESDVEPQQRRALVAEFDAEYGPIGDERRAAARAVLAGAEATADVKAGCEALAAAGRMRQRSRREYATCMADERIDVEMPAEVVADLRRLADEYGVTVNTLMREIAEAKIRDRWGVELVREWEAEHGAFTAEEMAETRREIADTEARYLGIAEAS